MKSVLVAALLLASTLPAAADAGKEAIAALGEINGTALACQQTAIVSRARNALQTTAPKTRDNGEAFEQATNAAFLAQGKGRPCPDAASLAQRLGTAEQQLSAAFKSQ